MPFENRPFPEGVLYARVDQLTTYKDYQPYGLCFRLIGVDQVSFDDAKFNSLEGCQTFLIDVSLRAGPLASGFGYHTITDFKIGLDLLYRYGRMSIDQWLRIEYNIPGGPVGDSYGYALFQNAAPTYLDVTSITIVRGPPIAPIRVDSDVRVTNEQAPSAPEKLTAFHVGQGMCCVLHAGERKYLLDAGAGTPVKREAYGSGVHAHAGIFKNELTIALGDVPIHMVLSHPDSDHWRLLDWDAKLLKQIKKIYAPGNVAELVLCDKSIKPRVKPTFLLQVRDPGNNVFLSSHRSIPVIDDSNGQCLVSEVTINTRRALMPGDYVYNRMGVDINSAITALMSVHFDAVVVPHHGDKHSSQAVVQPANPGQSIAFFSAGNHLGYHHPRSEALTAHHEISFVVISKKWQDNIIAVDLI